MRFYLLDRLEHLEPNKTAKAIKCWSLSDDVFAEHFPGFPIVPGVYLIESMAQLMGILIEHSFHESYPESGRAYPILSIVQKAKFREPIIPGDQCKVEVQLLSLDYMRASGQGKIYVDGILKAEADLSFTILEEGKATKNPYIGQRDEYYLSLNIKNTLKGK